MEKVFGLIGQTVSHSFSKAYFDEKFFREGLRDYRYELFPLGNITEIERLLNDTKGLTGLNVTIPYKEQVIKYLDEVDGVAKKIGAVNVIRIKDGKLKGFNTDSEAFQETLDKWLPADHQFKALVLGTGGSSKAVQEALNNLKINYTLVSRDARKGVVSYSELEKDSSLITNSKLIINTTPLGMSPNTEAMPPIDYELLGADHYVYDLIYNPARTLFLQKSEMRGAVIKNGLEMLHVQAEKSWAIWN
ncbi:shikimate dehydrogenase family protein [Pseudochryseolinea flava]|uniref:Shikimate dehydrogenase n=1 Tax=Pseudochryseolinea flava TaxID=2059302 RepID=A0A364XU73_9BACT|nr:shikimate dehydrogenase [Pseudochryseolinea flava]RAV97686.1 shikimate dehydrogenase [Pseudochryseolinea flava]